jgi:hypothetical protein
MKVSTQLPWTSTPSSCFPFIHPSTSPTTCSTECPSCPVGAPSDQTSSFTLPYLTLPYLTLPYLTLPYLTLPYLSVVTTLVI